ncbi:Intraflagellar transport protein 27 [Geranomyces variabilis]|nr:Intraflagellar transport protein 27 [Geranomyces variabilis]
MTVTNAKLVLRTKCVVLASLLEPGNSGTGKSALVQMFHSDGAQYPKTYAMTIHCDVCVKVVNIPDTNVSVELFIHDVGGNDAFQEYLPRYLESATSFIILYDTTNAESFKSTARWLQLAQKASSSKQLLGCLVASKVDQIARRVVSAKQGEDLARAVGLMYFECSSVSALATDGQTHKWKNDWGSSYGKDPAKDGTKAATNTDVDAPFYYISSAIHDLYEETVKSVSRTAGVPE